MHADKLTLRTHGLPTSVSAFGDVTATTSNGKMPGGVAVDATDPAPEQAATATRLDQAGLASLHTSPLSWVLLSIGVFVYLNAKARRSGKG